jgi:hypothetical protein
MDNDGCVSNLSPLESQEEAGSNSKDVDGLYKHEYALKN